MPFTSAPGTFTGTTSEWLISHTTFSGSIVNAGTIGAGGIVVISSTFTSGNIEPGTVLGGIHIDSSSKIFASSSTVIPVEGSTFGGGITNAGTLLAGPVNDGVHVLESSTFSGGITNSGQIMASAGDGIAVNSSVGVFTGSGPAGGIANSGTIAAGRDGIVVGAGPPAAVSCPARR